MQFDITTADVERAREIIAALSPFRDQSETERMVVTVARSLAEWRRLATKQTVAANDR
jgi:hypothetical protein